MSFLRLRQVCLVAADLEREAARIGSLFGLEICHRDPNVAQYGLENVLFPVGATFLEIVSPTRPGTAAGRFLERHGGKYGYMVILDCDDPERYRQRAQSLGVRVANLIRHDAYFGVQLHPKDTGGAMLEFNATVGGAGMMGPYAPAGPDWQRAVRTGRVRSIAGVEIEAPDRRRIAERWSSLLERPIDDLDNGNRRITLDAGTIDFVPAAGGEEVFSAVVLDSVDQAAISAAARTARCLGADGSVEASGMRFARPAGNRHPL